MNAASVEARFSEALLGATIHGPVPDEAVVDAEQKLGVSFPPSLRVFLVLYGAALGQGFEIAGLPITDRRSPDEPPLWSHLVEQTTSARSDRFSTLQAHYVLLGDDGMDCRYLLDTREKDQSGECPVVALGPGRDYERVANSFVEFLERLSSGETP